MAHVTCQQNEKPTKFIFLSLLLFLYFRQGKEVTRMYAKVLLFCSQRMLTLGLKL